MENREKAYLVLSNGTVFEGFSFGADAECTGCFYNRYGRLY